MKALLVVSLIILTSFGLQAQSWNDLFPKADTLFIQGKYEESLEWSLRALDFSENNIGTDSKQYADALNLTGLNYFYLGQYDKAVHYFQREVTAKKSIYGDTSERYARALNNYCSVLSQLGRDKEAEPALREAFELKRVTLGENDTSLATTANVLGAVCFKLGKLNDAEKFYFIAYRIRNENKSSNIISYAYTVFNMGTLYKELGNYITAQSYLEESYNIFKQYLGNTHNQTLNALSEIAMNYLATGDFAKAKPLLVQLLELKAKTEGLAHPDYLNSSYNLAMYYWSMEDYTNAEKLLSDILKQTEKSLGNGHPLYSRCLNSLGLINWQQNKLNEAMSYLTMAEKLRAQVFGKDHKDYATSLHNLAALQREMGLFDQAERNYKEAFDLYVKQINTVFPFLSEAEKAKFYANLQERFDMFNLYVMTRFREKPALLSDMYNYRLITKGILLDASQKVRRKINEVNDSKLIELFERWISLRSQLSGYYSMSKNELQKLNVNLKQIEAEANTLEKELSDKSLAFKSAYQPNVYTWKDIQKALGVDEAAIEIFRFNMFDKKWTDSVYYVALIVTKETKDQPDYVLFTNGYDLEKYYIKYYHNSIRFKLEDNLSYKIFWKDIHSKIATKKHIYVSLDGVFNKLNINSLKIDNDNYVIDLMNVIILSNTVDIIKTTAQRPGLSSVAYLFGNPQYAMNEKELSRFKTVDELFPIAQQVNYEEMINTIPQLPATEKEIKDIEGLLKSTSWTVKSYQGLDADETRLKQIRSAGIIHLATHGYFMEDAGKETDVFGVDISKASEDPMLRSGLLFSGASNTLFSDFAKTIDRDNGILTAYEAASLDFDGIDLMVLSACETGLGEVRNGEGVYGLQRAFLIAGAKKLIMSLWKIDDRTTQKLMTAFYRNKTSGRTVEESLKAAQIEIKKEYPNPYYWGAFIIIGK